MADRADRAQHRSGAWRHLAEALRHDGDHGPGDHARHHAGAALFDLRAARTGVSKSVARANAGRCLTDAIRWYLLNAA